MPAAKRNGWTSTVVRWFFLLVLAMSSVFTLAQPGKKGPVPPVPASSPKISSVFDVRDFGAVSDTITVNTTAIQSAIDGCYQNGGGVVLIAGGPYVTGTLYLKSNVCLRIESGATLLGSKNVADYAANTDRTMYRGEPYMDRCLIFANGATNITIEGRGTIDGQGKAFPAKGDTARNRPKLMRLMRCANVRMRDVTLKAPASWTTEWRYCTDVAVDGITIYSRANSNGDGLDFDGCTNVRVSNSAFDTSDDSICLQTSLTEYPCRDVTVTNCHFTSRWAGVRIGLLSRGDFENITITNCTFRNHNDSGLKIQMNEGAEMKNMVFSNLAMQNVPRPVFFTFTQQNAWVDAKADSFPPMKRVYNILFSNITVENNTGNKNCAFIITGVPGHPLENISFSDIRAVFPGGGTEADAKTVLRELTVDNIKARWPEYSGLRGTVPAHGLYARHVKGLTVRNVAFATKEADARPPVVFVDVSDAKVSEAPPPDNR